MQGVSTRVAMELMGWSQESVARRYQHPVDKLRREAVESVAGVLRRTPRTDSATGAATGGDAKIIPLRRKAV